MTQKVLLVEDDKTLLETLEYNLARQGYEVIISSDGREALKASQRSEPDLIILDLMLPGMDGIEVCRRLRRNRNVPIIMLTARSDEVDKIVGLEMGADDYMTKPFSMRELLARVKALLRRVDLIREDVAAEGLTDLTAAEERHPLMEYGNLTIDPNRREVRLSGTALRMKPKEFDLLIFLAKNRGIALSRSLILQKVWGWTYDGSSRTVDVHVRWLREKIEPNPGDATRIVTVRGIGYRFEG